MNGSKQGRIRIMSNLEEMLKDTPTLTFEPFEANKSQ